MADNIKIDSWQEGTADMSGQAFREYGSQVVDWIAEYLDHAERYPVLSRLRPGDLSSNLPEAAPDAPEAVETILRDFYDIIIPGITHWNHPAFFAYFAVTGSGPGILGEMLAAALNVNGMLWKTSPAATELEATTLNWVRQMLGLPSTFEGIIYDTASISTLVAIAAAREATGLHIRQRGMAGRSDMPALRLYCSDQAHSSVEKAAITLGLGQDSVRKIGTDSQFRLDVAHLRRVLDEDLSEGHRPFCVVGVVGTTSTTSVDPIDRIADVCEQYQLWLHVDAAYGGVAAMVPEMAWVLKGAERAHSIVINPHKWLFTPIDISALYSTRLDVVRQAFSLVPEYLKTAEDAETRNYMDYGPQLGRRFRALKLWFVLRSYGRSGIISRLREHLRLARLFNQWIQEADDWELMAPTPLSTVCFRVRPRGWDDHATNRLNKSVLDAVNRTGETYLSHTSLNGQFTLRLAIGHLRTTERHLERAWELLVHESRSQRSTIGA